MATRLQHLAAHFLNTSPAAASHLDASPAAAAAADDKDKRTPVALVLGAGAGIGQAVARKFANKGYHVVVVRRGAGPNRLLRGEEADKSKANFAAFVQSIIDGGGLATAIFGNATEPIDVKRIVKQIEEDIGPIHFINYNVGAQVGNRSLDKTSYRIFEVAFKLGSLGAFAIAKEASPYMIKRGHGTIIYTSATAAYRGNAGQHAHTMAMGGRKNLTQSLNAELGPQGIHIVHVNVDGLVNAPETAGQFDKERFQKSVATKLAAQEILEPPSIADTYYHLHMQPRSIWTLDLDVRPWKTKPWFNS